jgi:hypothetical protein
MIGFFFSCPGELPRRAVAAQFNNRELRRKLCHDGVKCVSSIGKFSDNVRAHAGWACGSRVGVCPGFQECQESGETALLAAGTQSCKDYPLRVQSRLTGVSFRNL